MRLDEYLVRYGFVSTRSKAKRAILLGFVLVNSKKITKPSYNVTERDHIELLSRIADYPEGYWKLMSIEKQIGKEIVKQYDTILDIGSSAGGFIRYALQKTPNYVVGIEISKEFKDHLDKLQRENENVMIYYNDVFNMDLAKLGFFDVILCDLTIKPNAMYKLLEKLMSQLNPRGRLLFSVKLISEKCLDDVVQITRLLLRWFNEDNIHFILLGKKEIYIYCEKK